MLEMFETVDSPSFGMTFDTGNAYRYGDDPVDAAKKMGRYIFAIHFKDVAPLEDGNPADWFYNACTPIGRGVTDVPGLVAALEEARYDGLYAIEFDYLDPKYGDEDSALVESIEYLKTLQL
jgi:sugar phosphate isomerase/epimerase